MASLDISSEVNVDTDLKAAVEKSNDAPMEYPGSMDIKLEMNTDQKNRAGKASRSI